MQPLLPLLRLSPDSRHLLLQLLLQGLQLPVSFRLRSLQLCGGFRF